ncbi:MAG: hypothetical protein P8J50_01870 [Acidimicrobiales bacterium]|jgi:hypothetical protein|nr:hypothetical protein [Acidimicrobiales bacterium]
MRVQGERFTSIERNLPTKAVGRVCGEPECEAQLSIYNEQEFCALHAPMVVPRMRGKVLDD